MSITSFSKPSDNDVLKRLVEYNNVISFVGEGSVLQSTNETIYIRTVKVSINRQEMLQNVIFIKKGISWFFKAIEDGHYEFK